MGREGTGKAKETTETKRHLSQTEGVLGFWKVMSRVYEYPWNIFGRIPSLAVEGRPARRELSLDVWLWAYGKGFRLVDPISNPSQGLVFTAFYAALLHPVLGTTGTEKVGS